MYYYDEDTLTVKEKALMEYSAPQTLAQAIARLADNPGARVLAGGTDLLVQLKLGLRRPRAVVDVKRVPELNGIRRADGGIRIGAATPGVAITDSVLLQGAYPGVAEAVGLIGSTQVQGRCSAGGNLCNASPAADSVPALIAAGALCVIAGPEGERRLPVEQFNTGPGRNGLAPGELLVALWLPELPPRTSDAYLRFIPRTEMDIAVAGAAVALSLDGDGVCTAARVGLGAVAPTALLAEAAGAALVGTVLDATALDAAARAARDVTSPISDKRGTADYRRQVVGVLVRRAAEVARNRALEKTEEQQ